MAVTRLFFKWVKKKKNSPQKTRNRRAEGGKQKFGRGVWTPRSSFSYNKYGYFYIIYDVNHHVEPTSSHIQDITDYLNKMTPLNPLFQRTILFSINITALYTNISESDGKETSRKAWDSHSTLIPPTLCSVHLLTTFFLQINMTPSYGNALMTKLEKNPEFSHVSPPTNIIV